MGALMDRYTSTEREKELIYLSANLHDTIELLSKFSGALKKTEAFLSYKGETPTDEESSFILSLIVDLRLDEIDGVPKEAKTKITEHVAAYVSEKLEKIKDGLEWDMSKAASDAIKK